MMLKLGIFFVSAHIALVLVVSPRSSVNASKGRDNISVVNCRAGSFKQKWGPLVYIVYLGSGKP